MNWPPDRVRDHAGPGAQIQFAIERNGKDRCSGHGCDSLAHLRAPPNPARLQVARTDKTGDMWPQCVGQAGTRSNCFAHCES